MQLVNFKNIKILAISDTHGQHRLLDLPEVDIIVHAGDACENGDENQLEDFFKWFSGLPIRHKIFLAGNHDLIFDLEPELGKKLIPSNVTFLENNGIKIEGIHFFGLVARPWMHEIVSLPIHADVLISHGPPKGILDENTGCLILLKVIDDIKPSVHLFGHIHSCGGNSVIVNNTTFYNTASFPSYHSL
jgi:predicted phosphodiesterase